MLVSNLELLRSFMVLVFGLAVSLLFSGVRASRTGILAIATFFLLVLFIQMICLQMFGLNNAKRIYPFITHLPLVIFLSLYFKRTWLISINSVLTAYLCCQIPRWFSLMAMIFLHSSLANYIIYFVVMFVVYFFLKRYIAASISQLIARSTRTCLLFGMVPLLYYLFDHTTTIYTNLLYTGAREVVHFIPSLICTFYFVFILLYYNESQKQANAQRERDIFASQLQQAQYELNTMRQMQESTVIYRHDMRHHLSLIGGFAADGNLQKIKEYLAVTETYIDALTPIHYCDNETVNLILSTFETRAKNEHVILQLNVKLPQELGISDTELCALLSNALENAITAATQVEEETLRKVYFQAIVNGDKLVISTENAYEGKIEMEGELPKPNIKGSKYYYGIKSMATIVERHGGLYSIETDGGVFVLQLMLPLGEENTLEIDDT